MGGKAFRSYKSNRSYGSNGNILAGLENPELPDYSHITYLTFMTFFLIHFEIKLNSEHRFMIGLVKLDILQVLHDRSLILIAAV